MTEDRQLFANCLAEINEKVAPSAIVTSKRKDTILSNILDDVIRYSFINLEWYWNEYKKKKMVLL